MARLRTRKRTRGARSPDIDPYSRETRETNRERPRRMFKYLGNKDQFSKSETGLPLKSGVAARGGRKAGEMGNHPEKREKSSESSHSCSIEP